MMDNKGDPRETLREAAQAVSDWLSETGETGETVAQFFGIEPMAVDLASALRALAQAAPPYCETHQHYKWCEHNGGSLGPNGWTTPLAQAAPPPDPRFHAPFSDRVAAAQAAPPPARKDEPSEEWQRGYEAHRRLTKAAPPSGLDVETLRAMGIETVTLTLDEYAALFPEEKGG